MLMPRIISVTTPAPPSIQKLQVEAVVQLLRAAEKREG
jgi:hypothetical protein